MKKYLLFFLPLLFMVGCSSEKGEVLESITAMQTILLTSNAVDEAGWEAILDEEDPENRLLLLTDVLEQQKNLYLNMNNKYEGAGEIEKAYRAVIFERINLYKRLVDTNEVRDDEVSWETLKREKESNEEGLLKIAIDRTNIILKEMGLKTIESIDEPLAELDK